MSDDAEEKTQFAIDRLAAKEVLLTEWPNLLGDAVRKGSFMSSYYQALSYVNTIAPTESLGLRCPARTLTSMKDRDA